MSVRIASAAGAVLLGMISFGTEAQLAVSGNDGKMLRPGEPPASRTADSVSIIDLNQFPPKVLGTVAAPASLVGPPSSLAVAPDESFAIVSGAQKLDASDPPKNVANDTVSVIDLTSPGHPTVIQTLQTGPGPTGVSINRDGTLALVANVGDDSISVFSIAGKALTPVSKISLEAKAGITDVDFTPDGKSAVVTARAAGKLLLLSIDGTKVTDTGVSVAVGDQPYGVTVSPNGAFAYNVNTLGRPLPVGQTAASPAAAGTPPPAPPRIGTVTVVDLKSNVLANTVDVGVGAEHAALSPKGDYLAVTVVNGSSAPAGTPNFNDFGLLKVYRVEGATLTAVAETKTGHWCQGAAWNKKADVVLLQCALEKHIEVYRFDGKTLTQDKTATLKFDARPGGIGTATSR